MIAERQPATGLKHAMAFSHSLPHHVCPVGFTLATHLVDNDFIFVPIRVKTEPGLPDEVEFTVLYFVGIGWISENVIHRVWRDCKKVCAALCRDRNID